MIYLKILNSLFCWKDNPAPKDGYQIQIPTLSFTCLWGPLSMCALAPSQAVLIASSDGVPKRSVIKSNYKKMWNTDGQ